MGNDGSKQREKEVMRALSSRSFNEFLADLDRANELARKLVDGSSSCLNFALVELNSDKQVIAFAVLWRSFVRVHVRKISVSQRPLSPMLNPPKLLNVKQFYDLYFQMQEKVLLCNKATAPETIEAEPSDQAGGSSEEMPTDDVSIAELARRMSATTVLKQLSSASEECFICMENKPEVVLPCLHAFCRDCIGKWSNRSSTCPLCRQDTVQSTDEQWEMAEPVPNEDIADDMMSVFDKLPKK